MCKNKSHGFTRRSSMQTSQILARRLKQKPSIADKFIDLA